MCVCVCVCVCVFWSKMLVYTPIPRISADYFCKKKTLSFPN